MKIAVIGAGFTGLTAAYYLSQKDHQVVIFEKQDFLGGLASGFKEDHWSWSLERFYHHLFASDQAALKLLQELKLFSQLKFYPPNTAVFLNQKQIPFSTPLDLLKFPSLNFPQKLRLGLILSFLKINPFWQLLESYPAYSWLKKSLGEKTFRLLWQPLLQSKFGRHTQDINLAWFWARIKKRSSSLGYPNRGFQIIIAALVDQIQAQGGKIFLQTPVKKIKPLKVKPLSDQKFRLEFSNFNPRSSLKIRQFDKVIVTTPTPIFLKINSRLPRFYRHQLEKLQFLSAFTLILILKKRLTLSYWLNITQDWPFVALIEHTNMISPQFYGGDHSVYLGTYADSKSPLFKKNKEEVLKSWLPYLKKVNPKFKKSWLKDSFLFKEDFAQPIVSINHSLKIPSIKTPIKNLYLANQSLVYPYDRGINYAIELGEKAAEIVAHS